MAYQHKPNNGTIFDNDRKVKDTHPYFKGSALIDGKEYWVSGWNNERSGENRRISLAFEIKKTILPNPLYTPNSEPVEHPPAQVSIQDNVPF